MFEHTRALFEHLNRAGEASPATTLLPIAISGAVALSGVWIAMDHRPWMRFAVVSDVLWLFFGRGGFPSLVLLGICFWILSVPASPGESEVGRV